MSFFFRSLRIRRVVSLAVALLGTACSVASLTDVDPPSNIVPPGGISTQTGAVALYNGAITNFAAAYAGSEFSIPYVTLNGVFSDEYTTVVSGSFLTTYDLRMPQTSDDFQNTAAYDGMQKARISADEAIRALKTSGGTAPTSYIAELYALKGYVFLLLSELYCSGVPFGTTLADGGIVFGAPRTTQEMLTDAIAQFDSALAIPTDSARITGLAAVGKGRAYLDLGEFDNARAAVAAVSTGFSYKHTYNASSFPNYLANERQAGFQIVMIAIPDPTHWPTGGREGNVGINYATANDARLATVEAGFCFFPGSPSCYLVPAKITDGGTPITLADGAEARLIEAEAALHAGEIATWAGTLNTLRATASVPALTTDSTTTAPDTLRENIMFRERALWLFGTGHRTGDMRRMIRQYNRGAAMVFPSGLQPYFSTPPNVYGSLVNLEPPRSEIDNNPKYHGCLNRDA